MHEEEDGGDHLEPVFVPGGRRVTDVVLRPINVRFINILLGVCASLLGTGAVGLILMYGKVERIDARLFGLEHRIGRIEARLDAGAGK